MIYRILLIYADINECDHDDGNNCHENAQCTNTEGSFTCSCQPGYTGDGINCTSKLLHEWLILLYIVCKCHCQHASCSSTDNNECSLGTHTCDRNANCTDTDGSYNCTCINGFEGDGFSCIGKYLLCITHSLKHFKHYFVLNSIKIAQPATTELFQVPRKSIWQ